MSVFVFVFLFLFAYLIMISFWVVANNILITWMDECEWVDGIRFCLSLSLSLCFFLGLVSFLSGEAQEQAIEELRTEQPTDPYNPVETWEELRQYTYPTTGKGTTLDEQSNAETIVPKPIQELTSTTSSSPAKESKKTDTVNNDIDISKLDIRVGVIRKAWEHPEADKLFCEEIDIGEEGGPRQIASGLKAYYNVDELIGQRVLVLANLKERKLVGFPSHGMVLCASGPDKVEFIEPPEGAAIGERVFVEGYDGEPATENQIIKKKMLDLIFPDLKTNSDGVATYKGVPLSTSAGVCRAKTGLPNVPIA